MIYPFSIKANDREVHFSMDLDRDVKTQANLLYFVEKQTIPEPEVVAAMARILRPGDVAIDCGANIGFFTILMAKLVGTKGWVYAFEPESSHNKPLRLNIQLNELQSVSLHMKPLWSQQQKLAFIRGQDTGQSRVLPEHVEGCVSLWAATLDHEIPEIVKPRLIKLDVEGSELEALRGAGDLLARHHPYLIAELNEPCLAALDGSSEALRSLLRRYGYETYLLHPHFAVPVHIPARTKLVPVDRNTNILYCSEDQFVEIWPEVRL